MFFRCIDGFSRKIIWLRCASSNHNPAVIATYFVDSAERVGGYPAHVRTDCGTENTILAAIQCAVMGNRSAHVYGTSPGNQRIEAWWSFFRRYRTQWWIEIFEDLIQYGAFHPSCIREVDCLRYCFMHVVQKDLDAVQQQWNTHRIRPSPGARCPAGVPDELFYLPPPPAVNCLHTPTCQLPQQVSDALEEPRSCDNPDFQAYLDYLCGFHNWPQSLDSDSALQLYFRLLPFI